ncbi:MAG: phage holin family protein [Candidatus Tectomicrobia bacterium]|uniref:Phage holin family protein n=1 Tax=Tectimicrobiota bacterium TaxID=2528274 RepID=A0A932CNT3_UNCTE|nr:phage holin family protein [Candidatus Tectomicrobia bacterium]
MRNERDSLTLAQLFERLRDDIQQLFKVRISLVWVELQEKLSQIIKQLALAFLILVFIPLGFLFLNVGLILFFYYHLQWSLPLVVLAFGGINFLLGGAVALWAFLRPKPHAPLPEQREEEMAPASPIPGGEDLEQVRKELEVSVEKEEQEIAQTLSEMTERVKGVVSWKKWVKDYPVEIVSGAIVVGLLIGYRPRPSLVPAIAPAIRGAIKGTLKSSLRTFIVNGAVKKLKGYFEEKQGKRMAQIPQAAGWTPNGSFKEEEGVSRGRISR